MNPSAALLHRLMPWAALLALFLSASAIWLLRRRLTGRRLLLSLAALLLAAAAGEGALRARPPRAHRLAPFVPHRVRHHVRAAGTEAWSETPEWRVSMRWNSLGLRGPEPAPKAAFRVLVLGDSFTEGYGVDEEETFCALLSKRHGVDVLNAGCGSYSPLLEWKALQELGPKLRPDLILLLMGGSDLQDDRFYARTASFAPDGGLLAVDGTRPRSLPGPGRPAPLPWRQRSALYRGCRGLALRACDAAICAFRLRPPIPEAGNLEADRMAATREGTRELLRPDLARTEGYLLGIRDLCGSLGARFAVAVYPYGHQVDGREWARGRLQYGFLPGDVAGTWFMDEVGAFGKANGIPVIDVTPGLKRAAGGDLLYFPRDGHWTAAGHAAVAGALEGEIRRLDAGARANAAR